MQVEVAFSGSVLSVEALARFLKCLETLVPAPVAAPKVVMGDDGWCMSRRGLRLRTRHGEPERRWRRVAPRLSKAPMFLSSLPLLLCDA
jgi:hypothetical protein